ncbi:MAG: MFS transporter [Burkholderiaceae bacterium]
MSGLSRPLARLIAGQICLHACMAGTRMAAPLLALRAGYSEAAVGVLLALFALTQVFLALPAGRYVDRHGLKRPLAWSIAVASSGAALAVVWPVFPVLCASALMTGGATGAAVIALQRHVGRMTDDPTQLRQVFSWLSIGPAISNFIGPLAAGLLIDHAGFRAAFALMALLPLLCWWWVRHVREAPGHAAPADAVPDRAMDLLRDRSFRRLLIVNWVMASCWDVHTFVVPVLGHELGFSASVIGAILGAFAIAAAAVRVVLPLVAAHLREHRVIAAAMPVCALVFAVYPLMRSPLAMGLCSVLLGLALGCVQPMVMSTLHQITPSHRHGEALGLRLMAINASSVLMPLLFGAAGAIVGIKSVFWAVGAVAGTGIRAALRMKAQRL